MLENFKKPTVAVLGGDIRNTYLTELLIKDGFDAVYAENRNEILNVINRDCVIFPLPVTKDGVTLNCNNKIGLVDIISKVNSNSKILSSGFNSTISEYLKNFDLKVIDYYSNEQVLNDNAYLTAEAVLKLLIENTDAALIENSILIIGNGRCGRALADLLNKLSCDVTMSTRNLNIENHKQMKIINTYYLGDFIGSFDIIVNTSPELVLDDRILSMVNKSAVIVELASQHTGVDMDAALRHKLNAIYAPALPGKYSPKSAAKVLYKSIYRIIMEEFT